MKAIIIPDNVDNQPLPETDDHVRAIFDSYDSKLTGENLWGIYQIGRARGRTVLESYEDTLKTHIRICRSVAAEKAKSEPTSKPGWLVTCRNCDHYNGAE